MDVPAGQDNIALTDSIVSKDVVVPARTDTVAETVATTTPALTTTPKENVQAQSPAPKKSRKRQLHRLSRILWGIRLWEQKPLIPSRKGKR